MLIVKPVALLLHTLDLGVVIARKVGLFSCQIWGHDWAIQDLNKKPQHLPNKALSETAKTKRVQNSVHNLQIYPELYKIIEAWPSLPEHIKKSIITLIQK